MNTSYTREDSTVYIEAYVFAKNKDENKNDEDTVHEKRNDSTETEGVAKEGRERENEEEERGKGLETFGTIDNDTFHTDEKVKFRTVAEIQPIVYDFKILQSTHKIQKNRDSIVNVALPPNWLYHDHVFGVIWTLFCKRKKYLLGISPLHWCLNFLLDLKNSNGEYTGDVNICIQKIQDDLLEKYAELGVAYGRRIESSKEKILVDERKNDVEEHRGEILQGEESGNSKYDLSDLETRKDEEKISKKKEKQKDGDDDDDDNNDDTFGERTFKKIQKERAFSKSDSISGFKHMIVESFDDLNDDYIKPKASSSKNRPDELSYKNHDGAGSCSKNCGKNTNDLKHSTPISLTFNEMVSRGTIPCTRKLNIYDVNDSFTKLDETKKATGVHETENVDNRKTVSTDEVVEFFDASRRQYVERIRKELEGLYSLEKFMKNIGKRPFTAFITNDLARRLHRLEDREIVKGVDKMIK